MWLFAEYFYWKVGFHTHINSNNVFLSGRDSQSPDSGTEKTNIVNNYCACSRDIFFHVATATSLTLYSI